MPSDSPTVLFREILDYLDTELNPRPTWIRRKRRLALIGRVQAFLASSRENLDFPEVVEETRKAWAHDPRVRIDEQASISADPDGLWVTAKLLAGGPAAWASPERVAAALASLPPSRREIFRLYRAEHLDHAAIAARLGLDTDLVQSELIATLIELNAALRVSKH